jgi:hypothetical protein
VTPLGFDVSVSAPFASWGPKEYLHSEDEALALAREWVGPNRTTVTIQTGGTNQTFGTRHVTWKDGEIRDSGWRCWINGAFIGAGTVEQIAEALA